MADDRGRLVTTRWIRTLTCAAALPPLLLLAPTGSAQVTGDPPSQPERPIVQTTLGAVASAPSTIQSVTGSLITAPRSAHVPVPALPVLPSTQQSNENEGPAARRLAFRSSGIAANESTDLTRFVYTVPLFSLDTGEPAGTITHNFFCLNACTGTHTYRFLNGGEIVAGSQESFAPDLNNLGFTFYHDVADADNILSAAGPFAERSGRAFNYGLVDIRKFPAELTFKENLHVIELKP